MAARNSTVSESASTQYEHERSPTRFGSGSKEPKDDANLTHARPAGDAELADGDGEVDAVWGKLDGDGPNYRSLGWKGATIIQVKMQVGLGILGLPLVMRNLGLVLGVIVIVVVAALILWSNYGEPFECGCCVGVAHIQSLVSSSDATPSATRLPTAVASWAASLARVWSDSCTG